MKIPDYNKINYEEDTLTVIDAKQEALEKAKQKEKEEKEKSEKEE